MEEEPLDRRFIIECVSNGYLVRSQEWETDKNIWEDDRSEVFQEKEILIQSLKDRL